MKNIFLIIAFIFLLSCNSSINDSYSGYIFYENKPVVHAKIVEQGTNNFVFTNDKGFFNLKRHNLSQINNIVIVNSNKAQTDTIDLLRGGAAGERKYYLLVTSKNDTIDLNRERIFKKQQ